jgi:hypothetical protein
LHVLAKENIGNDFSGGLPCDKLVLHVFLVNCLAFIHFVHNFI